MSGSRRVLFVGLLNDPGSDRIVAEMGRLGAECAVVGPAEAFAAKSRYAIQNFAIPNWGGHAFASLFLASRLEKIVRRWPPDLIVPIDDLAARVLRDRRFFHRSSPEMRRLLEVSLGAMEFFDVACSRKGINDLARRLGLRAPHAEVTPTLASAKRAAARFGYPVVLKRELTCGGRGVVLAHDEADLERAYRRERFRAEAKRKLGWVPGFRLHDEAPLSLQQFIPGRLGFRVSACASGEELDGVNFLAEFRCAWETGASAWVRHFEHAQLRDGARAIVAALKCSGLVSLDFIIDDADEAYLLELNARPIASGHLGRLFGHDILAATLHGVRTQRARPLPAPEVVALFPRALDRAPGSRHLQLASHVYHDIPWEDREMVEAYSKWLDRRHPDEAPVLRAPQADAWPTVKAKDEGAIASSE